MLRSGLAGMVGLFAASVLAASVAADPAHCPPGHAKKGWCSPGTYGPPGIRRGDRLARDRYVVIVDYDHYRLPRPDGGTVYARVDERIVLLAVATGVILDVLSR
ncbi:MAG: RcnB family protein [Pseudomonadota bacterium]